MSLPSRAQQWYSDVDVPLGTVDTAQHADQSVLLNLLLLLTGGVAGTHGPEGARPNGSKWTVDKSSNGVAAGTGMNIATIADLVRANAGTNHSWLTAHNADGLYVCFDYSSGADQQCNVYISASAFNTGGTVTDRPTSAGEGPAFGTAGALLTFWDNTASAGWVSSCVSVGGSIYFKVIKQGQPGGLMFTLQKLDTPDPLDVAPFIATQDFNFGGTPCVSSTYCGGRNSINTANVNLSTMVNSGNIGRFTDGYPGNNPSGLENWQQVEVRYGSGSSRGTKGYLADALWGQANGAKMEPTGGPYERCRFWGMWLPFSVQPSQ